VRVRLSIIFDLRASFTIPVRGCQLVCRFLNATVRYNPNMGHMRHMFLYEALPSKPWMRRWIVARTGQIDPLQLRPVQ
jgi:hypothetical protein